MRSVIRSPNERRSRPAQARIRASARPSSRRRRRVSTLPAIVSASRSGRRRRSCATRRGLAVATRAPCGSSCTVRAGVPRRDDEGVPHVGPRRDGRHEEVLGVLGRDVLERVDGEVDLVPPEGVVEGADEDADGVARGGDPPLGRELVPFGPDEDLLDRPARRLRQRGRDVPGLRPGQEARARPHPQGSSVAHRRPSFQEAAPAPRRPRYSPSSSLKRALTTAARVRRSEASPSFRPIVGLWRILWRSVSVIRSTTARSSGERRESLPA